MNKEDVLGFWCHWQLTSKCYFSDFLYFNEILTKPKPLTFLYNYSSRKKLTEKSIKVETRFRHHHSLIRTTAVCQWVRICDKFIKPFNSLVSQFTIGILENTVDYDIILMFKKQGEKVSKNQFRNFFNDDKVTSIFRKYDINNWTELEQTLLLKRKNWKFEIYLKVQTISWLSSRSRDRNSNKNASRNRENRVCCDKRSNRAFDIFTSCRR